jgi:hypothetical protein
MGDARCPNCGVALSQTPEADDLHPVQMRTPTEDGHYCEACAFGGSGAEESEGEYEHAGDAIVRASRVGLDDEQLAAELAGAMHAQELRSWMSAHGLRRSRGARKLESAEQAVGQDRTLVAAWAEANVGGVGGGGEYSAMCSCGLEEHYGSEEAAVEAARSHKSDHSDHFPKAWGPDGERLYG